jgi:hypothetical protein
VDLNDRAFGTAPQHPKELGVWNGIDTSAPQYTVSPDEMYLLTLMADNGGQYFSRENKPN